MEQNEQHEYEIIFKPAVGSGFAIAAGLSFFLLAMILPLVGPSGAQQPHYGQNKVAFLMVLLLTFLLSGFATWSKLGRRKVDGSPRPWFSMGLSFACVLTLVILLMDGFSI